MTESEETYRPDAQPRIAEIAAMTDRIEALKAARALMTTIRVTNDGITPPYRGRDIAGALNLLKGLRLETAAWSTLTPALNKLNDGTDCTHEGALISLAAEPNGVTYGCQQCRAVLRARFRL